MPSPNNYQAPLKSVSQMSHVPVPGHGTLRFKTFLGLLHLTAMQFSLPKSFLKQRYPDCLPLDLHANFITVGKATSFRYSQLHLHQAGREKRGRTCKSCLKLCLCSLEANKPSSACLKTQKKYLEGHCFSLGCTDSCIPGLNLKFQLVYYFQDSLPLVNLGTEPIKFTKFLLKRFCFIFNFLSLHCQ